MDTFVEDALGPLVGVGLVFLLTRQLMYGGQISSSEFISDPVVFSLSVLVVLYTATVVGILVELTFFSYRANDVRKKFQHQMVVEYNPVVYLFTRNLGSLKLSPLMPLSEWLERGERLELSTSDSD